MPQDTDVIPRLPARGMLAALLCALLLPGACSEREHGGTVEQPAITFQAVTEPTATFARAETSAPPAPVQVHAPTQTLPPADVSLTLLGKHDLGGRGFGGNVRALGTYAYVGSWGAGGLCPALGVRIVDVRDPASPTMVATAARFPGTSAEDVLPVRVSTPTFTGDLLLAGIQRCGGSSAGPGGLAIVDVTNPRNPVELSFFPTGPGPAGVHELDVLVRDGRVFALLATWSGDQFGTGGVRFVEITDPRAPVQVAAWGVRQALGITRGIGCTHGLYAHSISASRDGMRAYVSNWDAGVIVLDISDITAPRVVTQLIAPDTEGSVHSAIEMPNGLLLVTEEDDVFSSPRALRLRVMTAGRVEEFAACEGEFGDGVDAAGIINAGLADGGALCTAPLSGAMAGLVALADEGGCSLEVKAARARAAGAVALILIGEDELTSPAVTSGGRSGLPVVRVSRGSGLRLRELAGQGATVQLPSARPWGGLAVWDISDPANPVRRAYYRTENALAFPAPAPGYYTAHTPLSAGRFAIVSWYADGVRLLDMANPDAPREVASFVPPPGKDPLGLWPPAAEVWGMALLDDLLLVSDINTGLYVLRVHGLEG